MRIIAGDVNNCGYLTTGKPYDVEEIISGSGWIIDDFGNTIVVALGGEFCQHIQSRWYLCAVKLDKEESGMFLYTDVEPYNSELTKGKLYKVEEKIEPHLYRIRMNDDVDICIRTDCCAFLPGNVGWKVYEGNSTSTEEEEEEFKSLEEKLTKQPKHAFEVLEAGVQHMKDRSATYDKPSGERSMVATVKAFEAITGVSLTEEQGWMFMVVLKAVRSQQGVFKLDNYEDLCAYGALMAEPAQEER